MEWWMFALIVAAVVWWRLTLAIVIIPLAFLVEMILRFSARVFPLAPSTYDTSDPLPAGDEE